MSHQAPGPLRPLTSLAAVLAFAVLVVSLGLGISPNIDAQLVKLGDSFWPGYGELRAGIEEPDCSIEDLDARLATCPEAGDVAPAGGAGDGDLFDGEDPFAAEGDGAGDAGDAPAADPFAGDDPFAAEGDAPAKAPAAPAEAPAADPFAGDDPFAAEAPAKAPAADPFAGDDPFAAEGGEAPAEGGDPFAGDDPFAEGGGSAPTAAKAPSAAECQGIRNFRKTCQDRWDHYGKVMAAETPANQRFKGFELIVGSFANFPFWKHMLILLVVLGAVNTTARRMHIALRNPHNIAEHRLSQGAQLLSHLVLVVSCGADFNVQWGSYQDKLAAGAPVDMVIVYHELAIPVLWVVGFGLLAAINVMHLASPPKEQMGGEGSIPRFLMVVPLYAWLTLFSGAYFFSGFVVPLPFLESHASGQAIYLHKFLQFPNVYLGVGLYIWAGMLFSITRVATLSFGLIRPWGLPPALMAWLVVVLAAIPTAYSGASGIFVLAAGAVIYQQLRLAGASPRVAIAATAMSGSLGVVLRPCLVVLLISFLNNDVTTDQLFGAGLWVFGLTAVLALIAFLVKNEHPMKLAPAGEAVRGMGSAGRALVPFLLLSAGIIAVYVFLFGTRVDEHTAMLVLPAMLLLLVVYDRRWAPSLLDGIELPRPKDGVWRPLVDATSESSEHIGAILMLMAASVCLGGIVERSDVMSLVPDTMGGAWPTMAVLVIVMVLVGMTMDALGAVVLVSVSLAGLARKAGIDPVHFWMMVLVAFELGYLTPPVALNHLLARQVIGAEAEVENDGTRGFLARNEHIILPMVVMGIALLIVAFGPLLFY